MDPPADIPVGIVSAFLSLARQAGIGKEHIDRAEFGFGCRDQRFHVFFKADVGGDSQSVEVAGDIRQPVA